MKSNKTVFLFMLCLLILGVICSCSKKNNVENRPVDTAENVSAEQPKAVPTNIETPNPIKSRGELENIPTEIKKTMSGISMPKGASVAYEDLAYLTIPYHNFDGEIKTGHMVVSKELANEILDIFEELFEIQYPIQSINLIDEYENKQTEILDTLDRASMGNNNTTSFCYRVINGSSNISQHAFGRAIDLNPKINPYVYSGGVSPKNAQKYVYRSGKGLSDVENRAMIHKDDAVYKIFISHGWKWGAEIWEGIYDYQHFQKEK